MSGQICWATVGWGFCMYGPMTDMSECEGSIRKNTIRIRTKPGKQVDSGKDRTEGTQKTSSECGQLAAECPRSSQSSQMSSDSSSRCLDAVPSALGGAASSLSRSHVKMSWPGRSQISHTSSPVWPSVEDKVDADDEGRWRGSSGRSVFEDFFWLRASLSLSRSISRSSSSSR